MSLIRTILKRKTSDNFRIYYPQKRTNWLVWEEPILNENLGRANQQMKWMTGFHLGNESSAVCPKIKNLAGEEVLTRLQSL